MSYLITVIAGGTGSVKLVRGLASETKDLVVISNVGDNIWLYGLYVCPDIDTIVYGLAGILDRKRGWGVRKDSFNFLTQMKKAGQETWFKIGDRDLVTHIVRTSMLKNGQDLYQVTKAIKDNYNIRQEIVPATNDPVTTTIVTNNGKQMHLQEFWVKYRGRPKVIDIKYDGIDDVRPNPVALDAIRRSTKIIIAPGNPITSIGPTVVIKEIRRLLAAEKGKVVAVSPVVGKSAITGPAIKYMKALKLEDSPFGVARYYSDFAGKFVMSSSEDERFGSKISGLGIKVYNTNIIMRNKKEEKRLARYLLEETK